MKDNGLTVAKVREAVKAVSQAAVSQILTKALVNATTSTAINTTIGESITLPEGWSNMVLSTERIKRAPTIFELVEDAGPSKKNTYSLGTNFVGVLVLRQLPSVMSESDRAAGNIITFKEARSIATKEDWEYGLSNFGYSTRTDMIGIRHRSKLEPEHKELNFDAIKNFCQDRSRRHLDGSLPGMPTRSRLDPLKHSFFRRRWPLPGIKGQPSFPLIVMDKEAFGPVVDNFLMTAGGVSLLDVGAAIDEHDTSGLAIATNGPEECYQFMQAVASRIQSLVPVEERRPVSHKEIQRLLDKMNY